MRALATAKSYIGLALLHLARGVQARDLDLDEEEPMKRWQRLPADTTETCDYAPHEFMGKKLASWSWSQERLDREEGWRAERVITSKDRCGTPAVWVNPSTCGCGSCNFTMHACDEHKLLDEENERELRDEIKKKPKIRVRATEVAPGVMRYERK